VLVLKYVMFLSVSIESRKPKLLEFILNNIFIIGVITVIIILFLVFVKFLEYRDTKKNKKK
jgi:heme/copper-type cytochrome/quinol oxidase subunit 2